MLGVPARSQRTGFGFAVTDDTAHHKVRVVEGGAIGMWRGVPELAALVDRSRGLGGDPARKRELAEQPFHPVPMVVKSWSTGDR